MAGEQSPVGGSDNLERAIDLVTAALRALDRVTQRLESAGLPTSRAQQSGTRTIRANLLSALEDIRELRGSAPPTMPDAGLPTLADLIEQRFSTICQRCAHERRRHMGEHGLGACAFHHGRPIVDPVSHQVTSTCSCWRFTTTPTPREGQ